MEFFVTYAEYIGEIRSEPNPDAIDVYFSHILENKEKELDFTFYVPEGFDNVAEYKLPNVEVTSDPAMIFTARFNGDEEVWA